MNAPDAIVGLRNAGLSGPLREAIDNAIELVARCRHLEIGDLTLHTVIATDTILNPFNAVGDTSERFAIFAAMLTKTDPSERLAAYRAATLLYPLRNQTVHQSRRHGDADTAKQQRVEAFGLFVGCVKAVAGWAAGVLASGKVCGPRSSTS